MKNLKMSKMIRLISYGLYIRLINNKIYCSAITETGFPEENDNKTKYLWYNMQWRYTLRDKSLLDVINARFNTQFDLKILCGKKWYNRLRGNY